MTCDEFENSRAKREGQAAQALTPQALEHLRICTQCRELQALRDLSADTPELSTGLPPALHARIAQDITGRLRPVSPLPPNSVLITVLLSLAALVCVAGAWWQGHDGWLELAPWQAAIIFGLLGAGMSLTAMAIARQMVPASRPSTALTAMIGIIGATLFVAVLLMFPFERDDPNFVSIGMHCWKIGVECSAAAGALFYFVVRRGAWLSPLALGTSTGLFAGLAGLTVLEIFCPYLDSGHIGVWHFGAALTAALTGAAIGSGVKTFVRRA